jgi:hypothetical protein
MKWIAVESSVISALGYEARQRRLGIEFREMRQVYFYYEVPASEFDGFLEAESKGRYLTLVFLPKNYAYTGPYLSRTRAA